MSEPKSKASPKHSPTPWETSPTVEEAKAERDYLYIDLLDARGECLANFHNSFHGRRAIREAIQAVNSHEVAREMADLIIRIFTCPFSIDEMTIAKDRILASARKFQEIDREQD